MTEVIEHIAQSFNERFGKVDLVADGTEATLYFRAEKPDSLGRFPAILCVHFVYRADKWWVTNKVLSVPIWEQLRNCDVASY